MTNIIPVNNELHRSIKIKRSQDFSRFSKQHLIPITAQDFAAIASELPIVFVKNTETGQFTPVAMMGIKEGVNLYCQNNNYSAHVFPKGFLNAPLSLTKSVSDPDDVIICIDLDSPYINDSGEAIFNNKGEKTEFFESFTKHLLSVAEGTQQTQSITQLFANKKLFMPQTVNVSIDAKGNRATISGVYIIDEKALSALDDNEFIDIKNKGLLPLIYSHLSSLYQIGRLSRLQIASN
jgi:hypothetical protein